jgi:hypothetical protein
LYILLFTKSRRVRWVEHAAGKGVGNAYKILGGKSEWKR